MNLADVDLKVVGLGVRLGAVGTDKGSRSCVNHKVSLKLPCGWKSFATLIAFVIVRLSFVQEALVCVLVKKISQKMEPRKQSQILLSIIFLRFLYWTQDMVIQASVQRIMFMRVNSGTSGTCLV